MQHKNHSHTSSAVSRQVYAHALLVQHLSTAFFQDGGLWSIMRNSFNAEKAENLIKIYRFYRAEEDNQ